MAMAARGQVTAGRWRLSVGVATLHPCKVAFPKPKKTKLLAVRLQGCKDARCLAGCNLAANLGGTPVEQTNPSPDQLPGIPPADLPPLLLRRMGLGSGEIRAELHPWELSHLRIGGSTEPFVRVELREVFLLLLQMREERRCARTGETGQEVFGCGSGEVAGRTRRAGGFRASDVPPRVAGGY